MVTKTYLPSNLCDSSDSSDSYDSSESSDKSDNSDSRDSTDRSNQKTFSQKTFFSSTKTLFFQIETTTTKSKL